jgi:hypothetical protein
MTAKLAMMMFGIFQTDEGRTAVFGGILASQVKNPMTRKKDKMNGAMNAALPHPSTGPSVRARIKQMRAPIMSMTPRISSRRQVGVLSGSRGVLASGIRVKAIPD